MDGSRERFGHCEIVPDRYYLYDCKWVGFCPFHNAGKGGRPAEDNVTSTIAEGVILSRLGRMTNRSTSSTLGLATI
jgi:hypothetical protein